MKPLFDTTSARCSRLVTRAYSTSFSIGIRLLDATLRDPVYAIYGFVRFADEIVDSFHGFDQRDLLLNFKRDTYQAIETGISLNPILNSFQHVVRQYNIRHTLIDAFLHSMEMDLTRTAHSPDTLCDYIYGSAEVVGLMCLHVFCNGDPVRYQALEPAAKRLGAAFQKVNFLRDLHTDIHDLNRLYFPGLNTTGFNEKTKAAIEADVRTDFQVALDGIRRLPPAARFGVYVAYVYYRALLKRIEAMPAKALLQRRLRVPNHYKFGLLIHSFLKYRLGQI